MTDYQIAMEGMASVLKDPELLIKSFKRGMYPEGFQKFYLSMVPTLENDNRLLVSRIGRHYKTGDILILNSATAYLFDAEGNLTASPGLDKTIVKRLIAQSGQTVDIDFDAGIVYVDGTALDEPYTNTLTKRDNRAFTYPLTIPEGYTEIRPGACAGLDSITEVRLPSTLQKICSGAFSECTSLRVLDIPASVTVLEEDAFEDCDALSMVAVPSHLAKEAKACFPNVDLAILD